MFFWENIKLKFARIFGFEIDQTTAWYIYKIYETRAVRDLKPRTSGVDFGQNTFNFLLTFYSVHEKETTRSIAKLHVCDLLWGRENQWRTKTWRLKNRSQLPCSKACAPLSDSRIWSWIENLRTQSTYSNSCWNFSICSHLFLFRQKWWRLMFWKYFCHRKNKEKSKSVRILKGS